MDVIHSIASYLVTNEGSAEADGDVNWLFPSYSKVSGTNAGRKLNSYIKSLAGKVNKTYSVLFALTGPTNENFLQSTRLKELTKTTQQVVYEMEVQTTWLQTGRVTWSHASLVVGGTLRI